MSTDHSLPILGETETLRPLTEQAKRISTRPHHVTLWRWGERGIKKDGQTIKLEVVRIGGKLYCTDSALERFFEACNEPAEPTPRPRTRRETQAAVAKARRVLGSVGIS